jgi:hypothetical protein
MKFLLSTLLLVAASFYFDPTSQHRKGWNGIVPLHSTREDVQRELGVPEGECQCVYRRLTETVTVDYAEAPCKGRVNGWNVPKDTVLQIRVSPLAPRTSSDLGLEESKYIKTQEQDTATIYFTDVQRGVRYSIQDNHAVVLTYIPLQTDNVLRCAGFPLYHGGITDYHPYDSFPAGSIEQTYAHLDEFALQVSTQSAFTAYVIAYAGKISKRGEAKGLAETARNYLVNKRGIRADKVFAVDGGFRERAEFELHLVPNGTAAPAPKPTLTRCEVTLIDR